MIPWNLFFFVLFVVLRPSKQFFSHVEMETYSWVLPVLFGSKCLLLKETTHRPGQDHGIYTMNTIQQVSWFLYHIRESSIDLRVINMLYRRFFHHIYLNFYKFSDFLFGLRLNMPVNNVSVISGYFPGLNQN